MIDTEHRDLPICPRCGVPPKTWSVIDLRSRVLCHRCGIQYDVTRHVTVTFTTRPAFGEPAPPEKAA